MEREDGSRHHLRSREWLFVAGFYGQPEFRSLMDELANKYTDYAPGRFLKEDYRVMKMVVPFLLRNIPCTVWMNAGGKSSPTFLPWWYVSVTNVLR